MKATSSLQQLFKTFENTFAAPPASQGIPVGNLLEVHRAADLNAVRDAVTGWLRKELPAFEAFVFLKDPYSARLQLDLVPSTYNPPSPSGAWLISHLERNPSLFQRLRKDETVEISGVQAGVTSRPADSSRASVALLPVLHQGVLVGVFGILSRDRSQPTSQNIETMRACATEAAPVIARLLEMERLRGENEGLKARLEKLASVEAAAAHAIERNAQLEGLRQMRAHLHINLAHELRTPLAAVRGYARMVMDGRAGEVTDRQREYLNIVSDNTNKMIHLVNWMSRVFDLGEQEMRLEIVDFLDVWSKCLRNNESTILEKSLRVELTVPGEQFTGLADRNQIVRIFDQLLCSAIRFSDPMARLSVTFSHGREQETTIRIAGISQEIHGDRCEQTDRSVANIYDAVGVHGGRFFVRRTPEDGTVLLATLPAIRSEFH